MTLTKRIIPCLDCESEFPDEKEAAFAPFSRSATLKKRKC